MAQGPLVQRGGVGGADDHAAPTRTPTPAYQTNKRRFTSAALADHADNRAFGDFKTDIAKRDHLRRTVARRIDLADVVEGDEWTGLHVAQWRSGNREWSVHGNKVLR